MSYEEESAERLKTALDYADGLIKDGPPKEGFDPDFVKEQISVLRVYASNSQSYLDQMKLERKELYASETKLNEANKELSELKDKLEHYRTRETMHAGMCAAFEKSLLLVAQGFAMGE